MDAPDEKWQYFWDLHVMAAVRMSRGLIPSMRQRGGGVILNNASICAKQPLGYEPIYNMTKAALMMFSKCLSNEVIGDNIRVNCINPGLILTPDWVKTATAADRRHGSNAEAYLDDIAKKNAPIGRFASPEELAHFFVFMCSPRSSYCVGSDLLCGRRLAECVARRVSRSQSSRTTCPKAQQRARLDRGDPMKQAIMTAPGKIQLQDIAAPTPGPGEVLLRIQRIGVCGSDVHVYHGKHPYTKYPVVQGHEYSASVEAVGAGVTGLALGTKVTSMPQIVCGECAPCRRGDYHICDKLKVEGFQAPGCAQELWVTSADKIIPLPDRFSYEQGALVEPVSVAVHATSRAGNLGRAAASPCWAPGRSATWWRRWPAARARRC